MSEKKRECVLVLGAGNSRDQRMCMKGHHLVTDRGTKFDQNFESVWTVDIDPSGKPDVVWDLEAFPWPLPTGYFNEVHAYECLEHLGAMGDYKFFFALWREIWRVLKPGGLVCASTPWWQSVWAWQDPGHRRVYSRELLAYLDQREYVWQIGKTSMTDYRREFPPPHSFTPLVAERTGEDPATAGFGFVLRKEVWDEGSDQGGGDRVPGAGTDRPEDEVLGGGTPGLGED